MFDNGRRSRLNSFVEKYWPYFAAPILIISVFFALMYVYKVYPFGDACMSSYDMLAQVAPYIEHFFDVLEGKSSLFYSYSVAGGADVFGTLAYCCVSPFTFVFLLFGRGNVYNGTGIVLALKIACVAISALYYVRARFKHIPDYVQLSVAVAYAFCGYLFVGNTYISWVDLLIYAPLCALGLFKLFNNGNKIAFAIPLALMIYTCFSISCFALLLVFPLIIAFCLIVIKKEQRNKVITDFVFSLCIAIALSLPILLPSLSAFVVSGRKTGLFDNMGNSLSATPVYKKISYIFSDTFFLFFTFAYFFKNGANRRIDKFLAFCGIILMVPVIVDESMNLLNFGSYMSYSLRFGFLNGFYFMFVAAKYLDEYYSPENAALSDRILREKLAAYERAAYAAEKTVAAKETATATISSGCVKAEGLKEEVNIDGDKSGVDKDVSIDEEINNAVKANKRRAVKPRLNPTKKSIIISSSAIGILTACGIVGVYLIYQGVMDGSYVESFAGRFAHSLGGLEVTAVLFGIASIIALGAVLFVKYRLFSARIASIFLICFLCVQTVFYSSMLVVGNKSNTTNFDEIGKLTDYCEELDGNDNARIKMYSDYLTADMPFTLHTTAYSVFSSVTDKRNFVAPTFFAFNGNGSNTIKSHGGTMLGDCVLGNKFLISKQSVTRTYFEEMSGDNATSGSYTLYKNKYAFPQAFVVESGEMGMEDGGKYEQFNDLLKFLGGEKFSTTDFELNESNCVYYDQDDGVIRVRVSLSSEGNWYLKTNFPDDMRIKYQQGSWSESDAKILPKGETLSLGYGRSGTFSVYMKATGDTKLEKETIYNCCTIAEVANSTVAEIYEKAAANSGKVTLAPSKITVNINAPEGGYVFLNYVYLKGHSATVNGNKAEMLDNYLNFMLVKLEKGENTVVINYSSPYVGYAAIGALAAVMLLLLYYVVTRKAKKLIEKCEGAIALCAIALSVLLFAFYIILPCSVALWKAAKLGISYISKLFV